MKHMEIMQHEIEKATSRHTQGEILCLEAVLPEHQEIEADLMMVFKAT